MTTEDGPRSSAALPVPPAAGPSGPPLETQPGTTDPAKTDPAKTEPVSRVTDEQAGRGEERPARDAAEQPTRESAASAGAGSARRPTASGRKPAPKKKSFMRELPGIVITALVISVLIKTFLVQAFYIPSGSMENTLLVNDRVLVNKLADKPDEIHRGDIVVFRDPGGWLGSGEVQQRGGLVGAIRKGLVFVGLAPAVGEEDLIKRVIGVGGDRVRCCDGTGHITVNGVRLNEPYLYPSDRSQPSAEPFDVTVPPGKLWVMGDHRSVSQDSREHQQQPGKGFVPVSDVVGRAFTIVWPIDRARILHRPDTFKQPKLESSTP
ncbi:MAG: signal peptidase [Actinomycetota bacterium]|nr:signal peptidase [Actinomycetota bacterium]